MELTQVLTLFAIVSANIGTVIALYVQQDNKLEAYRRETTDLIKAIHMEIKDFHERMCALEEKGRK